MFSEDIDPFQPSENRITLNDNVVVQFCAHVFHTLRTVLFQAIILAANSPAANRFIFSRLFFYKKKINHSLVDNFDELLSSITCMYDIMTSYNFIQCQLIKVGNSVSDTLDVMLLKRHAFQSWLLCTNACNEMDRSSILSPYVTQIMIRVNVCTHEACRYPHSK